MTYKPRELASALYLATRDKSDRDAKAAIARFVGTLKDRGLAATLPDVLKELPGIANRADGIEEVTVETSRDISEKEALAIITKLGLDPERVEMRSKISSALMGGVRVKRESSVLDATVKHQLDRMRETLRA